MTSVEVEQAGWPSSRAYWQRGRALLQQGNTVQAAAAFDRAIARDSNYWPAYLDRGIVRLQERDGYAAIQDFEAVLRIVPAHAQAHLLLGNAWSLTGKVDQAMACYRRAAQANPDYADPHYNMGTLHYYRNQLAEAIECHKQALARNPGFALAHSNLGIAQEASGETKAALASYEAAIAAKPDGASGYWNKALLLLRNGEFDEGWKFYEWRWRAGKARVNSRFAARAPWLGGSSIAGKRLILHAEQGLGDTIQFARYAPVAASAGATVIMEVFAPLVRLLGRLPGVSEVVSTAEPLPAFDLHSPLMSLPLAFSTRFETIPCDIPYIVPDEERISAWRSRLGQKRTHLRIGIAWKGNPRHENDATRSMPFDVLKEALSEDVDWVCLQKDPSATERASLQAMSNMTVAGPQLIDFEDTCAVIALCDLVISVDTSVAHLAGAMGKPTWILLAQRSDWRWMRERDDSPWYPTVRLLRQTRQQGDWSDVIVRLRASLKAFGSNPSASVE